MGTPAFITQLQALASSATGWIAGLAIPVGGALFGWHMLARHMDPTADPQHIAQHQSAAKRVLIGTAIVAVSGAIVHFVSGAL